MRWNHARWKDCARGRRVCREILIGVGQARRGPRFFEHLLIGRAPQRRYHPPLLLLAARRL
eukprot:4051485-Prymnesium_polylepis.1